MVCYTSQSSIHIFTCCACSHARASCTPKNNNNQLRRPIWAYAESFVKIWLQLTEILRCVTWKTFSVKRTSNYKLQFNLVFMTWNGNQLMPTQNGLELRLAWKGGAKAALYLILWPTDITPVLSSILIPSVHPGQTFGQVRIWVRESKNKIEGRTVRSADWDYSTCFLHMVLSWQWSFSCWSSIVNK